MIPIPDRMKRFPLWKGKFPIHFTVFKNSQGIPEFKVVARAKQIEAINKNLCHLCGQRLLQPMYFIGGPECMIHRNFIDGPMHQECAYYAAQICPFLSNENAKYSPVENATKPEHFEHNLEMAGAKRPAKMCIAATMTYKVRSMTKQYPEFIAGEWISQDWNAMPQRKEG